ncbi:MAG: hypothetical protein ACOX6T_01925 [Myxococcales bacterium]
MALIAALALTVALQRLQVVLVRAESSVWWASNGRDLINAFSLGALGTTLWLMGFPGPAALFLAATILLVLNLFETVLLRRLAPVWNAGLSLLAVVVLISPLLVAPDRVNAWLNVLATQLFA